MPVSALLQMFASKGPRGCDCATYRPLALPAHPSRMQASRPLSMMSQMLGIILGFIITASVLLQALCIPGAARIPEEGPAKGHGQRQRAVCVQDCAAIGLQHALRHHAQARGAVHCRGAPAEHVHHRGGELRARSASSMCRAVEAVAARMPVQTLHLQALTPQPAQFLQASSAWRHAVALLQVCA